LNEVIDGSGRTVFKPWEERMDSEKHIESDADEELLINIPFTGNVKLKGILIRGANDDTHPARVRLFKNRPNMTFDDATAEAEQELELQRDPTGTCEYALKIVKFAGVNHLTLHFTRNFGEETTRIYYIGLKGDFTQTPRDAILIANYELAPNPAEHNINFLNTTNQQTN
jgi:hypothetical protein